MIKRYSTREEVLAEIDRRIDNYASSVVTAEAAVHNYHNGRTIGRKGVNKSQLMGEAARLRGGLSALQGLRDELEHGYVES
jgi:hypothetical protein